MAEAAGVGAAEEEAEAEVRAVGFPVEAPDAAAAAAGAAEDEAAEVAAGSEAAAAAVAEAHRRYTCPVQGFRANQFN